MKKGDILLHGHTHVPRTDYMDGHWILNPGSVSIPKGGSVQGYATLEDDVFTLKELDGTVIRSVQLTGDGAGAAS